MRNYIKTTLSLIILYLASCSNEVLNDETTVFCGRIMNNGTNEIRIENEDTIYKSTVNENGLFEIRFRLKNQSSFTYIGNEFTSIYLSPGDSIFMSVDARNWREFDKTLLFTGKGSEKNNHFFRSSLLIDELINSRKNELFSMKENEFLLALDSACNILNENYDKFIKENPHVNYGLLNIEKESIEYLRKDNIIQYYLLNHKMGNDLNRMNTIVDEIVSNLDINNKNHISLATYQQLIIDYFRIKLHFNTDDEANKFACVLKDIDSSVENDDIKASVLRSFIKGWTEESMVNDSTLEVIKNQLDPKFEELFIKIFNEEKPLTIYDKAPDFKLYDKDGNEYSLGYFNGSYIYIDVWASYCGPCIEEVSFFEQLKKDFKGKNISFISVSLDRKEGDWLSAINEHKMTDYQLKPENDWSSDFVNDYRINHYGIPLYIIIDSQANIVNMPAPKPSEANELLIQLL